MRIGAIRMDCKQQLAELREQIDAIDGRMVPLFCERMDASRRVAGVKAKGNMPILDEERERQVAERAVSCADEALHGETELFMRSVMAIARGHQNKFLYRGEASLLPQKRPPVTGEITCAFQGVPGAWSEQALMKIFPDANRQAVEFFEDVFLAVKEGRADYGVVAIENSKTGAIGETYDLLRKYGCFIVGRTAVDIHHCLLAPEGTCLSDIREVLSHPEGFKQCSGFLRGRAWNLTACRNTAVAAEMAAKASGGRTAAIGSRRAAELSGLRVLAPDIMDRADNRTSFVVISSAPEYDAASSLVTVTFSTAHRSGALCETLLPFMAHGINLMRIESRPAGFGKYRFFAELEGNVDAPEMLAAMRQAAATCEYFEVIGCYGNI